MPDIVASQLPPGAGRFQDFVWPDPALAGGSAFGSAVRPRNGSAAAVGSNVAIGGGAASLAAVVNGVPCAQVLSSGLNVGRQHLFYPGFPVLYRSERSGITPLVDDCAVYRFIISMCGQGIACAAGQDFGFELVRYAGAGNAVRLAAGNVPGIGLRVQDANVIDFLLNGPLGVGVFPLTAAPFDTTAFHTYDLRIFSATPTQDARLTLRIDGAPQALPATMSDWGVVNSQLPPMQGIGANVGFVPTIISCAGVPNGLFVQSVHMIAAPSELMTF